ncbi:FadR/GntR family transcriptional regulator [Demequina oxidasica]|uniref:FadR/GntR family transcriptional regulator n=1 Tax=Demequina oxidasica TaxID=676199 RepID=UPI000784B84A|nr:FCD domain-containing protein [Demequina oxidasica]
MATKVTTTDGPPASASGDGSAVAAAGAREGETALAYVLRELEELIVGQHEAGDQLPAETTLAESLGVSRLTIREGLKVLAGQGLVELSRGRRPTVRHPDSTVMSRFLTIAIRRDSRAVLELLGIRRSLEVLSASEAAKRTNRAALAAMSSALDEMQRAAESIDGTPESVTRYNSADVGFHEALALASGNQMLSLLLESLAEALHHSFSQSFTGFMASGGDIFDAVAEHRHIYDLVVAGDSKGAERAMKQHLDRTARDLQSALRGAESAS